MKIRNIIIATGILVLALSGMAFITPANKTQSTQKAKDYTFAKFLSQFEKIETPFEIGLNDIPKYEALKKIKASNKRIQKRGRDTYQEALRTYIPELELARFSRMGPPEIVPLARFYPNEKSVAVIYMTHLPYGYPGAMSFNLSVYDLKGNDLNKQLDSHPSKRIFNVARVFVEETQTFCIDENGNIWKNNYENVWEEDLLEKGIIDNKIVDYKLVSTDKFQIHANGAIKPIKESLVAGQTSLY